ncbi:MAG TPA: glycosyltransferase, partial [Acidimicrobiales bacterium]|nr:glycosyltransferase [Acidimicrobiales bacterium]
MRQGGPERSGVDAATLLGRLARAVPDGARTVLQVGLGPGWLGPLLAGRADPPAVTMAVFAGQAPPPGPSPVAVVDELGRGLDAGAGPVDCIVYADALGRFADPATAVAAHRSLLAPGGAVVASVPNLQYHGVLRHLLRGEFPYGDGGVAEAATRRLFTAADVVQVLLDAGYAPSVVDRVEDEDAGGMDVAGGALFELLGVGAKDAGRDLRTSHLLVRATPMAEVDPAEERPLTFVACVNDEAQLEANLARSPCLAPGSPHELLVFRDAASAGEGLNAGIAAARHERVVLVHQDVYLPAGWPARLASQWRAAEAQGAAVGVAGVFGVRDRRVPFDATGRVVHRDRLLDHRRLPTDVDGLDELLMVVPRTTTLRVDERLGWHLYGTDLALQAQHQGLRAVVLDAPCHHNSLTGRVPFAYRTSERVLARKWPGQLPIHTNLSSIDT